MLSTVFFAGGGGGRRGKEGLRLPAPELMLRSWLAGGVAGHTVASLAVLKRACKRDSSLWAHFRRSSLGKVLLLPCMLPFEYAYFQTRR